MFSTIYPYRSLLFSHFLFLFSSFFLLFFPRETFCNSQCFIRFHYNLSIMSRRYKTFYSPRQEKNCRVSCNQTKDLNIFVVRSMSYSSIIIKLLSFQFLVKLQTKKMFFSYHLLLNIFSMNYNYFVTKQYLDNILYAEFITKLQATFQSKKRTCCFKNNFLPYHIFITTISRVW